MRQHGSLNPVRQGQLGRDALILRRGSKAVTDVDVHILLHLGKAPVEIPDFVPRADRHPAEDIRAGRFAGLFRFHQLPCSGGEPADRIGNHSVGNDDHDHEENR